MSQTSTIQEKINALLDEGYTDKQKIYDKVVEDLKVPRPTVRRACRELAKDYQSKAEILKPLVFEVPQ